MNPSKTTHLEPEQVVSQQFLSFQLSKKTFSMPILPIKEIIEYGGITEVPLMPAFVRGVINLRGAVVPIIDLSARFGQGLSVIGQRSCIVIVETQQPDSKQDLGLIVDAVNEVVDIAPTEIEPAPSFGGGIRAEFIWGMAKLQNKFVIILDLEQTLSISDMSQLTHNRLDLKHQA